MHMCSSQGDVIYVQRSLNFFNNGPILIFQPGKCPELKGLSIQFFISGHLKKLPSFPDLRKASVYSVRSNQ